MSKNTKVSRNTISLITPNGIHNYIANAYNQAIILQQLHNPSGLKIDPKKDEKMEEKERRGSGRKSLRKMKKLKKRLRKKI